jgi:serine/threonine protein kinase
VWKQILIPKGEEELKLKEAKIALSINTPYVVPVLDYFIEDGNLYLVMDFFEEGTLRAKFDGVQKCGGKIPEQVLFYFS